METKTKMRRTQIQLDEVSYQVLKVAAFERDVSISALVREMVQERLGLGKAGAKGVKDFGFIGAGQGKKTKVWPVSERHDEALAEDLVS